MKENDLIFESEFNRFVKIYYARWQKVFSSFANLITIKYHYLAG